MNLLENIKRIKNVMGIKESLISIDSKLKRGDKGKEVEELQVLLGVYSDGMFGPQTEKCLIDFQTDKKIEGEEGVVGIETMRFLQKIKDGNEKWDSPKYCKTKFFNKNLLNKTKTDNTIDDSEIEKKIDSNAQVILMGGLDYRKGDKSINQQVDVVKKSIGLQNVIGHRYMNLNDVLLSIKKNPNAYVILFSAGCRYSKQIADEMSDKTKLFIVEPYAISSGTATSVSSAVGIGVPSKNVIVGPSKGRGSGVVNGATKTPSEIGHWGALEYVGSFIK
jgi:hypothetical protein